MFREMNPGRDLFAENRRPDERHQLPGNRGNGTSIPGGNRCLVRKPEDFKVDAAWLKELLRISHRGYCTGFYFGDPDQTAPNFDDYKSFHDHVFSGGNHRNV